MQMAVLSIVSGKWSPHPAKFCHFRNFAPDFISNLVIPDHEDKAFPGLNLQDSGHTVPEVIYMAKKKRNVPTVDLRLDPEARLCPAFDAVSIKKFAAPDAGEMGMRVLDNCAEEHMM